jgi:hypothetical protein
MLSQTVHLYRNESFFVKIINTYKFIWFRTIDRLIDQADFACTKQTITKAFDKIRDIQMHTIKLRTSIRTRINQDADLNIVCWVHIWITRLLLLNGPKLAKLPLSWSVLRKLLRATEMVIYLLITQR